MHDCTLTQTGDLLTVNIDNPEGVPLGINLDQIGRSGFAFAGRTTADSFTLEIPADLDPGQWHLDLRSRRPDGSRYVTVVCGRFNVADNSTPTCTVRQDGDGGSIVTVAGTTGGFVNVRSIDNRWLSAAQEGENQIDGLAGSIIWRISGQRVSISCTPGLAPTAIGSATR